MEFNKKIYPNRNRKKKVNLNGLYAVSSDFAFDSKGNPIDGVYGVVSKSTPYICKPQKKGAVKPNVYLQDMTGKEVPAVLKNRVLSFYGDKNNSRKTTCYLVEKPIYEEMVGHKVCTASKKSTSKKVTSRDNNSLW